MPTLLSTLKHEPKALAFGTSGLRGLVSDMTDLECYINTVGFIKFCEQNDNLKKGGVIYLAGDLRHSTPRIMCAICRAITDSGYKTINCGLIPTPALVYYAMEHKVPSIMVTGSHIPDDRNGIKFQISVGEVLKEHEAPIHEAVNKIRKKLYDQDAAKSLFDSRGMLKKPIDLPAVNTDAANLYVKRYTDIFAPDTFAGKKIVFYQHSSVGRELLPEILEKLGANVVRVGWADKFIPIDSENITDEHLGYFAMLAKEHPDMHVMMSADGDSDRPIIADETGFFHRGDNLGAIVADWLQADHAAFPISVSDSVVSHLKSNNVPFEHTKIGSPYVVLAMDRGAKGGKRRVVGWEVNGGFLIGSDLSINGRQFKALPTRDAIFPMIVAALAANNGGKKVSEHFAVLPRRFTQAGLIDSFPMDTYLAMANHFAADTPKLRKELSKYFSPSLGFGEVIGINSLDGVRVYFANGDIAHMRESNNAPQLRIYSVANSQERANQIAQFALDDPDGIFRRMQADFEQ